MFRYLLQIGVGEKLQEIVHRRIFASPVAERHQLVVEIAGGLARKPREIHVAGALALGAVARGAGEHARGHGIGRALSGLRLRGRAGKRDRCKKR